jgi:beta-galactosidase
MLLKIVALCALLNVAVAAQQKKMPAEIAPYPPLTNETAIPSLPPNTVAGFDISNGTFVLNGTPIRLFAGSLQHFRIHPQHWEHRLAAAKAMGLNAVQTLIPWMMMERNPGEFRTDGFMDIVKFLKMAQAAGLLVVLRPGPFICDGPDFGGFPWWLSQVNSDATGDGDHKQLRIRTADPAFLRRVDMFFTKLFALLRSEKLTAGQGGPIVMAQIENEYGIYGSDKAYLAHLRDAWKAGLGDGVVIHSTDPSTPEVLGGSRIPGVLQTIDFGYTSDPANQFATLKASQAITNPGAPQPLMCSEIYPGTLTYWGDSVFPLVYNPAAVAASIDLLLNTDHCQGSTSFALWLFASNTDFGYWGGTLFLGKWRALVPSYDFGAPVDEAGVIRPLFYMLQKVLEKHGATTTPPPAQPPVKAYGTVAMGESVSLWEALPALVPQPVASATVRTAEELGQGYGYTLYTAPIPAYQSSPNPGVLMGGMRDRALVYLDRTTLHQTCGRGATVDADSCTPGVGGTHAPAQLDILVENLGRVTGGETDSELTWRGINRYVSINGQAVANYTIAPLPLNNTATLSKLWKPTHASSHASASPMPTFFRGKFTIPAGGRADTFLTLLGWGKGQAWVNGNNLARYWSIGPQYSHYCPAGFLLEGENEVVLFETGSPDANLTVTFEAAHTVWPPPRPPQACPAGFTPHARGLWSNPEPCGHYPARPNCTTKDDVNNTAPLCAQKCKSTVGCKAFELFASQSCFIFVDKLEEPFVANEQCLTCVMNKAATPASAPATPANNIANADMKEPTDASDLTDFDAAKAEVVRLRAKLAETVAGCAATTP